jgi:hypothetical protein
MQYLAHYESSGCSGVWIGNPPIYDHNLPRGWFLCSSTLGWIDLITMGANKMEMGDTIVSLSLIFVSALQTKKFESSIWWKIFEHSLASAYHRKKWARFHIQSICTFSEGYYSWRSDTARCLNWSGTSRKWYMTSPWIDLVRFEKYLHQKDLFLIMLGNLWLL